MACSVAAIVKQGLDRAQKLAPPPGIRGVRRHAQNTRVDDFRSEYFETNFRIAKKLPAENTYLLIINYY